ncbi:MAG: flagellar basal body-associated FliL family protein, partial [Bdellovibrionales bacterium]|nr:flagellar basal body-associated FliL family protein [Bdellovibrionales bacterium]
IKEFIARRWLLWKGQFRLFIVNSIDQAKTLPDRLKKLISDLKFVLSQKRQALRKSLDRQTRTEKTLFFGFILGLGFIVGLVILNIKDNKWIPFLHHPLIKNLGEVADKEWSFDNQAGTVPFLTAFPQEKHNYLFPKVIVNLKLKEGQEAFTMGAFEFFVEVDSKDTAIEVKSREVELHDLIQRVTEQFSYETLQSDRGKERLKEDLKKALNQKIVQGWVKDVYIKFFITKP